MKNEAQTFSDGGPTPPEGIPKFIVGLSFLLSTFFSAFVAAYLAIQGSVDKYIEANREIKILQIQKQLKEMDEQDNKIHSLRSSVSKLDDKLLQQTEQYKQSQDKIKELEQKLRQLKIVK